MTIKKTAELYFKKNDIYILESHNNTIIINNNYQGLLLLDSALSIKKELNIIQEAPVYYLYKKYNNKAVILYLPDVYQIIFIDLQTSNHFVIRLANSFYQEILSPNYYWNDDILILTTDNNAFYQLDFISKTLSPISCDTVKATCPSFYIFWSTCKQYDIITLYPSIQSFIFQKNNDSLELFNHEQNRQHITTGFTNGWHDVEYNNDIFIFIHENKIELLHNSYKNLLTPHANFIFLKAKFLDNNHFVALSSNPSNYQESLLEIYIINLDN